VVLSLFTRDKRMCRLDCSEGKVREDFVGLCNLVFSSFLCCLVWIEDVVEDNTSNKIGKQSVKDLSEKNAVTQASVIER
jgi:hypothetical protein